MIEDNLSDNEIKNWNRRKLLVASVFSAPILCKSAISLFAQQAVDFNEEGQPSHNIFTYRAIDWQDHFSDRVNGIIIADTKARCLHFWNESGSFYKIYPTSVPLTPELTRTGKTSVIQKIIGPSWRPTEAMLKRDPKLPEYVGPGPENPLGTHALYLGWPSYRIHGTNDTRKIGRQSSSGCIGLYNEQIEELFDLVKIGTQVKLI